MSPEEADELQYKIIRDALNAHTKSLAELTRLVNKLEIEMNSLKIDMKVFKGEGTREEVVLRELGQSVSKA